MEPTLNFYYYLFKTWLIFNSYNFVWRANLCLLKHLTSLSWSVLAMFPFYETSLLYSRSRGSAPASSSGAGARDSAAPGSGASSISQQQPASSTGPVAVNPSSSGPGNNASSGAGGVPVERDSFSRWRDRHYFGPRRWFSSSLRDDTSWEKDSPTTGMTCLKGCHIL